MADATVAALQHSINRFASAGAFPVIATDGIWGNQSANSLSLALRWIVDHVPDPKARATAVDFQLTRGYLDPNVQTRNFVLANITNFLLTPVADGLGFKEALPPGASGGGAISPIAPGILPVTPTAPPLDPSGKQSSITVLGLQLPRWALYLGGGALALAVIGLVATRKKPPAQLQREIDAVLSATTSTKIKLPPGQAAAWAHKYFSAANTPAELAELRRVMMNPWSGTGRYFASRTGIAKDEINTVYQQHLARLGER